jgi:hypothetical protein
MDVFRFKEHVTDGDNVEASTNGEAEISRNLLALVQF